MTIIIPAHRALTSKLAGRSYQVVTRYGYNPWLARVNHSSTSDDNIKSTQIFPSSLHTGLISTRTYATTTAKKPVGRPKAHTGRTTAKKSTTTKKPGPKTAAGKSKVGRKPKTQAKAKPKAALKKPVIKRAPTKTALLAQRRARDKELKEKALLDSPKELPSSAYSVLFGELQRSLKGKDTSVVEGTKQVVAKYRSLTPEEKEHYNHIAHQNKDKNAVAFKKWLNQYTPEQIKEANNARRLLKAQWKVKYNKTKDVRKFPALQDERLVKLPKSAFLYFSLERRESGDFYKMTIPESSRLIGREWKQLDAASKKKYESEAQADLNRYAEEVKSVYGHDFIPKKKSTAA